MNDIIIYGTGYKAEILYGLLCQLNIEPVICIDSNKSKQGTKWHDLEVCAPNEVCKYNQGIIFIAATDVQDEIYRTLLRYEVSKERIKRFHEGILWIINQANIKAINPNDIRKEYTILFDTINGYNAGGVEEWSKSLAIELKNIYPNLNLYLVGPLEDCVDNKELLNNEMGLEIDSTCMWSIQNLCRMIEKFEKNLPIIGITSSHNILFYALLYLKTKYPNQVDIISVVHQGTDIAYKEYTDTAEYINSIIAVSEDIIKGLEFKGIKLEKLYHMTCPVKGLKTFCRNYSKKEEPIRIGYAGRIEKEQKRLDYLPLLVKELQQRNVDYYMEIAGEGAYLNTIRRFIEQEKLENKIKLLGKIDRKDIPKFWEDKDICVNLSDYEGRSISIMEAMANGAVPIVTKTSGVSEDIQDGINGYIVELGEYKMIAERIHNLSKERYLLKKFGERSYTIISEKSSMKRHMELWEYILKNFLQEQII